MATAPPPVLPDNLRRLLGLYGLSIGDAAGVLALSRQSVSELLRGNRQPSWNTVYRIAQVFEVSPDDLMTKPISEWLGDYAQPERIKRVDLVILDPVPRDRIKPVDS